MDVVAHHIGKPRSILIAQKESRTRYRSRMLSGFSGGGSFLVDAALAVLEGANWSPVPSSTGSFASGTPFAAGIAIMSFVEFPNFVARLSVFQSAVSTRDHTICSWVLKFQATTNAVLN